MPKSLSVSRTQCDVTITSFSFILPNLTDGSCSHEGISAPHPISSLSLFLFPSLPLFLPFFLLHLMHVFGPLPFYFSPFHSLYPAVSHSFLTFYLGGLTLSPTFPCLLLSVAERANYAFDKVLQNLHGKAL